MLRAPERLRAQATTLTLLRGAVQVPLSYERKLRGIVSVSPR
jgi:hypothetical protein